jgi:RNA polymerase sigma factor (sigma-70 family)
MMRPSTIANRRRLDKPFRPRRHPSGHMESAVLKLEASTEAPVSDEADLVRRAQEGDRRAFESLYRAHVDRVHATLWRIAGGIEARAEELTQDAFVRAWQKLRDFRGDSAFGTWLHRLAVNVALMDLRARRGGVDRESGDIELESLAIDGGPRPGAEIDLERAVAALPERSRAVLILFDIEGWKHEEIAAELHIAVGSSKAHLHRARTLLRRALGGEP